MKTIIFKKLYISFVACICLSACNNSGSSNGGSNPPPANKSAPEVAAITISDMSNIPLIGGSSITSNLVIHNNTNKDIDGITFTIANTTKNLAFNIEPNANCSKVNTLQSCELPFTSYIKPGTNNGSVVVTANYRLNNTAKIFTQTLNFEHVTPSKQEDMVFSSGLNIRNNGNKTNYGVVYLYSPSLKNKTYKIKSIGSDAPGVKIVQGNISHTQLASGFVQAIEVSAPAFSQGLNANLNVTWQSDDGKLNKTTTGLNTMAASGAILIPGPAPLIDYSTSASGSLTVTNNGTAVATIAAIALDNNQAISISPTSTCSYGKDLGVGEFCIINFQVNQPYNDGSTNVTINYRGGGDNNTVSQSVTWYNAQTSPLLQLSFSSNPLSLKAGQSSTTQLILSNVQNVPVTINRSPTFTSLNGSASIEENTGGTCKSRLVLQPGSSCFYNLLVTGGNKIEQNKQFWVTIFGLAAGKVYSWNSVLGYSTAGYAALVAISTPTPMTIPGDGKSSMTQQLTVTNNGNAPANISWQLLNDIGAHISFDPIVTTCTNTVAKSCIIGIKLNAKYSETMLQDTSIIRVTYSGGTTPNTNLDNNIDYTITPASISFTMTGTSASEYPEPGSGTESSPYIFYGSTTSDRYIDLTYTNNGAANFTIQSIKNNLNPVQWVRDDTPTNACNGMMLISTPPGNTCIIRYTNILARSVRNRQVSLSGSAYEQNLYAPIITLKNTGTQLTQAPPFPNGSNMLFVTSKHGVINTPTLTYSTDIENNISNLSVTVSGSGVNSTLNAGYAGSNVNFTMNPNSLFSGKPSFTDSGNCPTSGGCDIKGILNMGRTGFNLAYPLQYLFGNSLTATYSITLANNNQYIAGPPSGTIGLTANPSKIADGFAYIALDDSLNNRLLRCTVSYSPESISWPTRINPDSCETLITGDSSPNKIYTLKLLPNMQNLLIGTQAGINIYSTRLIKSTPTLLSKLASPVSYISEVKQSGNNYLFYGTTGTWNTDDNFYMSYILPIGSTNLSENEKTVSTTTPIGKGMTNMTSLIFNYTTGISMVIGRWPNTLEPRKVFSCDVNWTCSDYNVGVSKPYRIYLNPKSLDTWITSYDDGGGLFSYNGKISGSRKPTQQIWPYWQVADVISDGHTNDGVFVVGRYDNEICYMKDINTLSRTQCINTTTFKNGASYNPVAIEILPQAVYR